VGAALSVLHLRPGEVVGRTLYEYLQTADETAPAIAAHRLALRGEETTFTITLEGRTFQAHVRPLRAPDDRITGCVGIALDITARAQAEAALRRSEAHYRTLVDNAAVGIFRSSTAGRFLAANPALARMLGYDSPEQLLDVDIAADVYWIRAAHGSWPSAPPSWCRASVRRRKDRATIVSG
jgi:PAS domain-containing protein